MKNPPRIAGFRKVGNHASRARPNGARGRNRTADTMIFNHVLYQLSYPGIAAAAAAPKNIGMTGERFGSAPMAKRRGLGKMELADFPANPRREVRAPRPGRAGRSHPAAIGPDRDPGSAANRTACVPGGAACRKSGTCGAGLS